MRLPRRVPWSSLSELEQLCSWIYSEDADQDSIRRAIHRLSAWQAITYLPHALESTLSLLVVSVQDTPHAHAQTLYLRQAYAAAIIRLVNGFVDPLQLGAYARSIASIAHQLGLPQWLVELRHAATHEELPSLELLRDAAFEAKTWLLHNYFLPTLNPSSAANMKIKNLRPLTPLLKEYKRLSKVIARDVSLANSYKAAITTLIRDVERWISEAKVAANLAAGGLSWGVGEASDGASDDDSDRERWALEKLCDGLLEKGALVPLSKKKRGISADTYSPPILSIQIWSHLLQSLGTLHPELLSILCNRITTCLTGEDTTKTEDDPTFGACLARWLCWIIENWDSKGDECSLRREAVTSLMQNLGHDLPKANKNVPQAQELLLRLCDNRQEWKAPLSFLLQARGPEGNGVWVPEHMEVMDERLNVIQAFSKASDKDDTEMDSLDKAAGDSSPVAGWRQLSSAVWRPCPIGMHYPVMPPQ